jgi:carboxylesterase type B
LVINLDSSCWSFLFEEEEYENDLVVETRLGKVLGRKDGKVNAYLGIPYAEPPLGRYRFRPTRPKRPWYPAVLKAYEFGPECLQSTLFFDQDESRKRIMDEDCLFLNIWQPQKHPVNGDLWPVMVWIYGGAFIHGGSSQPEYNGKYLAEKGVIVVSLNYRLGALGFLVSVSDGLFGNYGLDDQKTAIQWIRDNIRAFNGDPDRITLFGESAGAMSIGLHLFDQEFSLQQYQQELKSSSSTPPPTRPKQLFHSIILQSNPFGYKYRNLAIANFIGSSYKELLDCEDLKCLQSESPEELIHVQDTLMAV